MEDLTLKGCGGAVCNCAKNAAEAETKTQQPAEKSVKPRTLLSSIGSVLMAVMFAFFPKCAFCWAAYFAAFNSLGFASIPYLPWLKNVFLVFMIASMIVLYRSAKNRGRWLPYYMQLGGISIMILAQYLFHSTQILWPAIALIFAGSLLNALPDSLYSRLFGRMQGV